jgi:LysR family transcriptional regulator, pca operon transcriptional activator
MESSTDNRIKFRHIQCFLAVLQLGTVQRAADSLSITQPAVSKTLAELEEIIGAPLFERGRHGAVSTRQGRLFAPHARACLAALRQGVDEVRLDGQLALAFIAIGVLPTVAGTLLPAALAAFRQRWPSVSVRVQTGSNQQLLESLQAGDTALAIGRLSDSESMAGMSFEHLYREPLSVVVRAGHRLLEEGSLSPAMLARYPIVVPPPGTFIRQSADSMLTAFGAQASIAWLETLSVSLGRAMALHNDAIWFVPSNTIEDDLASKVLARLPIPFPGTDEPIGLIRRSEAVLTVAAADLVEAIRAAGRRRESLRISGA